MFLLCLSGVCLSQKDFTTALKGFTPPSLWGVKLQTPSGFGLERVGGLKEVRQQLLDTILLPAKVSVTRQPGFQTDGYISGPCRRNTETKINVMTMHLSFASSNLFSTLVVIDCRKAL